MSLRIVASSDPSALAIRDHLLPLIREHGSLRDGIRTLRLLVLEHPPWSLQHWTPFNELATGEASSPGYRHALERQHTRPGLPYGLEISHDQVKVLSVLWADDGTSEIRIFRRGAWEALALSLSASSLRPSGS